MYWLKKKNPVFFYVQIVLVRKRVGLVTQNAHDAEKLGQFSFLVLIGRIFDSTSRRYWRVLVSLFILSSTLGLAEEAADPAHQSLDEGVAGARLAVQTLHLQQLPLQRLAESSSHVALQLRAHAQDGRMSENAASRCQIKENLKKKTRARYQVQVLLTDAGKAEATPSARLESAERAWEEKKAKSST